MTAEQMRDYAEENFDNPQDVLDDILQEVIDEKGLIYNATLNEAVQMYSRLLERKLKQYSRSYG